MHTTRTLDQRNSTLLALGVAFRPEVLQKFPTEVQTLFGSALVTGGIAALVLNVVLPGGVGTGPTEYTAGLAPETPTDVPEETSDLYGNANATHIGGTNLVNGIGGGDFNRNCRLGIIALPTTAGGGEISRIVPNVPHVDHTEHDHSVIVTEHGVADLRGLSPAEWMDAIIDPNVT